MTKERLAVAESPPRVAVIEMGKVPATCVVPEITPVEVLKLRPVGKFPEME